MIDQEMFEPYPVSGDEMRAIVEQGNRSLSALGGLVGQVDSFAMRGDLKTDLEVARSIRCLKDEGLLGENDEPGELYRAWIEMTLEAGLDPRGMVDRAWQEHVELDRFAPLESHFMVTEPNGRMFFFLNPRETDLAQAGGVLDLA